MGLAVMVVLLGVATTYPLHALLLEEKDSHEGPFKSKRRHVYFPASGHTQKAALFDWIRRIFGVYRIDGLLWTVDERRAERWTCPFCLSWWVALPFSIGFALWYFGLTASALIWLIPIQCAITAIAQLVHKALFDD